jgi:PAS domain S-box-containing protein
VLRTIGYEIVNVNDGVEALAQLKKQSFDLIISDVLMPHMDGFQLCRTVKKNPVWAKIPFVFYSGSYTDAKDIAFAKRLGAACYLLKPMEPTALLMAIRGVVENATVKPQPEQSIPDETDYLKFYNERLLEKLEKKEAQYDTISNRLQTAFDEKVKEVAGRLQVEDTLRLNEERYRSVVASLAEGIVLVDFAGNIVACNDSAALIFRVPKGKILASSLDNPIWRAIREDGTEIHPLDHPLRLCIEKGTSTDLITLGHLNEEGGILWLTANVRPCVKDSKGMVLLAVMSFTDVTEKRNLEEKFLRAQRLESIGILAGGVAHDLNNILAPILLAIPVVRSRVSDPQGLMMLDTMEASANRGAQIVRQILTFSRGLRTEKVSIQPRHLLKEIAELTQETFPRNIAIETDLPRTLWRVEADITQLHQVFMNLCVNARDAMPKGGSLLLSAENITLTQESAADIPGAREGSYVRISVTDTGTGMSPETMSCIFHPFFTTKDLGKGTGLGLSTARGIVLQHNGFMSLQSKVGKGSRFDVYLPGIVAEEQSVPLLSKDLPNGKGELILVVDDEFALRNICEHVLTTHGYKVLSADSGQQGLTLMRANVQDVALVITDLLMPGMSGAELIPLLKGLKPSLKIVAISGTGAFTGDEDVYAGDGKAPAGVFADAFLNKPFAAEHLLRTVKEILAD